MAIPAQRFTFLDQETNVAVSDFLTTDNSSILNSLNNVISNITGDVSSFIDNLVGNLDITNINSTVDFLSRLVKGITPGGLDATGFTTDEINGLLSGLTQGNTVVNNILSQLSSQGKIALAGVLNTGKQYLPMVDCNGNIRLPNGDWGDVNTYVSMLNSMSQGKYAPQINELNGIFNSIVSLSLGGYKNALCGTFTALSNGVPRNVLTAASGAVMTTLAQNKDTMGLLDMSKSSAGLYPSVTNPSLSNNILTNTVIPREYKYNQLTDLNTQVEAAAEIVDPNYNTSYYDNTLSAVNYTTGHTTDNIINLPPQTDDNGLNIVPEGTDIMAPYREQYYQNLNTEVTNRLQSAITNHIPIVGNLNIPNNADTTWIASAINGMTSDDLQRMYYQLTTADPGYKAS